MSCVAATTHAISGCDGVGSLDQLKCGLGKLGAGAWRGAIPVGRVGLERKE